MIVKLLTKHHLEFLSLKVGFRVYTCQNALFLEITCHGSNCFMLSNCRFKDEVVFQSSEKATISWDSETKTAALVIKTVGLDDSGKYTCIAYSDVGGHAMTSVEVQVRGMVDLPLVYAF